MNPSLATFITAAEKTWRENPLNERRGQAYFNCLWAFDTRVATDITGSKYDPFYDDERIPDLLLHLVSLGWE